MVTSTQLRNAENFNLISQIVYELWPPENTINIQQNAENVPMGLQMSDYHIVHPTGLLYRFMHSMSIFERNSMKFGKHVPE